MSATLTLELFERDAKSAGFDEVIVRAWEANTVIDEHTHPFEAKALVVEGEMWLTYGGVTHHIPSGGSFHLQPEVPHTERYGPRGATYWVARRNPPA
jgi:hypothetical protein